MRGEGVGCSGPSAWCLMVSGQAGGAGDYVKIGSWHNGTLAINRWAGAGAGARWGDCSP